MRSLTVRVFLLLLAGVALTVVVTLGLSQRERRQDFGDFRERAWVQHLAETVVIMAQVPASQRRTVAAALPRHDWVVHFGGEPPGNGRSAPRVAAALGELVGERATIRGVWRLGPECEPPEADCPPASRSLLIQMVLPDGEQVSLRHHLPPLHHPPFGKPPLWVPLAVFLVALAGVAWLAVRLALRPLRRMTAAAEAFGRNLAHPPLEVRGPRELRIAAEAFNAMQERIRNSIAERTRILAAITHDLKTPLTRLRMRLEQCPDAALKAKLEADLADMRALIEQGLELAGSLEPGEPARPVDLRALLQSLCDDAADAGQDVRWEDAAGAGPVVIDGRPLALRRLFSNLIDNARQYGHYAAVSLARGSPDGLRVAIRDGGPGIPEAELTAVLQPFYRVESSRSRDTGGTGLGLAIATNLAQAHGGRLELRNHPQGGLEASVWLPLRAAH